MENCTAKIHVPDYVTYILSSLGGVITILAVMSNFSMLLYIVKKKQMNKMFIFKIMIVVSVTATFIGRDTRGWVNETFQV